MFGLFGVLARVSHLLVVCICGASDTCHNWLKIRAELAVECRPSPESGDPSRHGVEETRRRNETIEERNDANSERGHQVLISVLSGNLL